MVLLVRSGKGAISLSVIIRLLGACIISKALSSLVVLAGIGAVLFFYRERIHVKAASVAGVLGALALSFSLDFFPSAYASKFDYYYTVRLGRAVKGNDNSLNTQNGYIL